MRHAFLERLGVALPIFQAPMAGSNGATLAAAVSAAGGLGALPCAMLSVQAIRDEVAAIRAVTDRPFALNFFCHAPPAPDPGGEARWRARLAPFARELGLDPQGPWPAASRAPFGEAQAELVEALRPAVVSFHFGLPAPALLARTKAAGAAVLSSATTPAEAAWLARHGADAIIAQGVEAGGHRGLFLSDDLGRQIGLTALLPMAIDAAGGLPVIAAGGLADARGIAGVLAAGAAAAQLGTAYLLTPEARTTALHRAALAEVGRSGGDVTALTNIYTGRPARGLVTRFMREAGPLSADAPAFPAASAGAGALRAAAEASGSSAFSPLWAGEAVALAARQDAREGAGALTRRWAQEAQALLRRAAGIEA
jgi:nitronate monooxygenase